VDENSTGSACCVLILIVLFRDLAKVTNWFRNLRQTSRRHNKPKWGGDDDDSIRSESREATPSPSSSSLHEDEHENDMVIDDDEDMLHTDDEDEASEAVTPPPAHSPSRLTTLGPSHSRWPLSSQPLAKPIPYDETEQGVRFEDAMLLLSFHNS
jgi:hypothetical protein